MILLLSCYIFILNVIIKQPCFVPELERMERRNASLITFLMEIFVLLYLYDKDLEYFDINIFIKYLHYIIDYIRGIFHKMPCWILRTELIFAMFPTKYGSDCAKECSFSCAS